ncbi:MAG: hypothetical protein HYZ27_03665, partial [Deltaproteobacteria bacterium]|nr:hypothetical protein [Deltaproteobacteria bacterium]
MADAKQLAEYATNVRALLASDYARWSVVVERQILSQLLRTLHGQRATLEPALWALLLLCLEGPAAAVPLLDDAAWEQAKAAALQGRRWRGSGGAAFPRAAKALAAALGDLRETGVYPRPLVGG